MAADPVVEYWSEIMARTPVTPEVMGKWKRVLDHSIEAWSRALSEVMATEEFAQLLGTSIEQWIAAQASFTGQPAQVTGQAAQLAGQAQQLTRLVAEQLAGLTAEVRRLEERLRQVESRVASAAEAPVQQPRRRNRRRRAA
jgi:hypothetical protein